MELYGTKAAQSPMLVSEVGRRCRILAKTMMKAATPRSRLTYKESPLEVSMQLHAAQHVGDHAGRKSLGVEERSVSAPVNMSPDVSFVEHIVKATLKRSQAWVFWPWWLNWAVSLNRVEIAAAPPQ